MTWSARRDLLARLTATLPSGCTTAVLALSSWLRTLHVLACGPIQDSAVLARVVLRLLCPLQLALRLPSPLTCAVPLCLLYLANFSSAAPRAALIALDPFLHPSFCSGHRDAALCGCAAACAWIFTDDRVGARSPPAHRLPGALSPALAFRACGAHPCCRAQHRSSHSAWLRARSCDLYTPFNSLPTSGEWTNGALDWNAALSAAQLEYNEAARQLSCDSLGGIGAGRGIRSR